MESQFRATQCDPMTPRTVFIPWFYMTSTLSMRISPLIKSYFTVKMFRTCLSILPDEHNNPNFGNIVPDNFPRLFNHLDLILSGMRSSSSILCGPLSKLSFCRQTWYCAAHSSLEKNKNNTRFFSSSFFFFLLRRSRSGYKKIITRFIWFCVRGNVLLLACGRRARLLRLRFSTPFLWLVSRIRVKSSQ